MATTAISPKYKDGVDYITQELTDKRFPGIVDGVTNYSCAKCQFSTTNATHMEGHLRTNDHRWPFPQVNDEGKSIKGTEGGVHPLLRKKGTEGGNV